MRRNKTKLNLLFMKKIIYLLLLLFLQTFVKAQTEPVKETADTLMGISGQSIYHKYIIEIVGNNKDTIHVFDSAKIKLPLPSEYYFVRVYRVNYKGELKDYKVKSFNLVFSNETGLNTTMKAKNKWMEDPLLSTFKEGRAGSVVSIGEINIEDESNKIRDVGSYQLFYF